MALRAFVHYFLSLDLRAPSVKKMAHNPVIPHYTTFSSICQGFSVCACVCVCFPNFVCIVDLTGFLACSDGVLDGRIGHKSVAMECYKRRVL